MTPLAKKWLLLAKQYDELDRAELQRRCADPLWYAHETAERALQEREKSK
jgi:hypothetical protein